MRLSLGGGEVQHLGGGKLHHLGGGGGGASPAKPPLDETLAGSTVQFFCGTNTYVYVRPMFYKHADAAYRFYRSRNEDQSAKRRGTFNEKGKAKRRHERLVRVSSYLWHKCLGVSVLQLYKLLYIHSYV